MTSKDEVSSFSGCRREHKPIKACPYCETERLTALDDVQCERMNDQARTIERLTAELQGTKDELHSVDKAAKELGAELEAAGKSDIEWQDYTTQLEAERDRLRVERDTANVHCETFQAQANRLRAALERIALEDRREADAPFQTCGDIAREALASAPHD